MEKINLVELLKDCPQGMELDCTMYDNCTYGGIEDYGYKDILINTPSGQIRLTKEGCYFRHDDNAKCVIFPKGKTTWEGFQRPFKDGDVVFYNDTIAIFKEWGDETLFRTYVVKYLCCDSFVDIKVPLFGKSVRKEIRFATEEEKQKLFDAIKDYGYRWDDETKTLEKLSQFKDGDILAESSCIFIIQKLGDNNTAAKTYCTLYDDGIFDDGTILYFDIDSTKPATEEEKQKLFQAIKDNGYKWNSETKTLEKLVAIFKVGDKIKLKNSYAKKYDDFNTRKITEIEHSHYILDDKAMIPLSNQYLYELVPNKFDITALVPFDKVLVRNRNTQKWAISFFSHCSGIEEYKYFCVNVSMYAQCVPYEENKHLCGTTNDCDEYYKTW